jgi:hypothetical protein
LNKSTKLDQFYTLSYISSMVRAAKNLRTVRKLVMSLKPTDRVRIVNDVVSDLFPTKAPKAISITELRRRRAAILAGKSKTTPAATVHAMARRIAGLKPARSTVTA